MHFNVVRHITSQLSNYKFLMLLMLLSFGFAARAQTAQSSRPIQVLRYFNPATNRHAMSTVDDGGSSLPASDERESIVEGTPDSPFFYLATAQHPGTVRLYRFRAADGSEQFVRSEAEREALRGNGLQELAQPVFVYDEPAEGASEIFRLVNRGNDDMVYTTSQAEKSYLTRLGWSQQGSLGYTQSSSSSGTGHLKSTTVKLEDSDLALLAAPALDGSKLVFSSSNNKLAKLAVGTMLYAPGALITGRNGAHLFRQGFMRRVTSVAAQGRGLVVETAQATYKDLFRDIQLHIDSRAMVPLGQNSGFSATSVPRSEASVATANAAVTKPAVTTTTESFDHLTDYHEPEYLSSQSQPTAEDSGDTGALSFTWDKVQPAGNGSITFTGSLDIALTGEIEFSAGCSDSIGAFGYSVCDQWTASGTVLFTPYLTGSTGASLVADSENFTVEFPVPGLSETWQQFVAGIPVEDSFALKLGASFDGPVHASFSANVAARATGGFNLNLVSPEVWESGANGISCPNPCPSGFSCGGTSQGYSGSGDTCSVTAGVTGGIDFGSNTNMKVWLTPEIGVGPGLEEVAEAQATFGLQNAVEFDFSPTSINGYFDLTPQVGYDLGAEIFGIPLPGLKGDVDIATLQVPIYTANVPTVTTGPVTSLGSTSTTVSGEANSGGLDAAVWFQYGIAGSQGCPSMTAVAQSSTQSCSGSSCNIATAIGPLQPDTTYCYQAMATNLVNTFPTPSTVSSGSIQSFHTLELQTINFDTISPNTVTYGVPPITLSATVTPSGLPVTFTVTSGPAVVSASTQTGAGSTTATLTITGSGSVTVTATQAGNTIFGAAVSSQTIVVNPELGNFGSVEVGESGSPAAMGFTLAPGTQIGGVGVLTQGATGKDFQFVSTSNTTMGCFADQQPRALSGYNWTSSAMTAEACVTSCASNGALYAGVQNGNQCFCGGNSYSEYGSSNSCNMPCSGNALETCGGANANSVYSTSAETITVNFSPLAPGPRLGAVVLYDSSTPPNVLKSVPLTGMGIAPQVIFSGNMIRSTLGSGFIQPVSVAVDGSGNVIVADQGNQAVEEILAAGGYSTVNTLSSGFNYPYGVAVDGGGNVVVADSGNNAVKEILAGGGYRTVNTLSSSFNIPSGVAVDGGGNVYVADQGNSAVKEILAGSDYATVNALGSGFSGPLGVAVDGNGNVFVADTGNNAVKEILAAGGYTTVNTLGSNFSWTYGVAVDASGNAFVADMGNIAVKEILEASGYSTVNTLFTDSSSGNWPNDVAVDASGNVYVTELSNAGPVGGSVEKLTFSDPPSLRFVSTTLGLRSSDSPQTVTIANDGNAPLTFPASPGLPAGFSLDSSSTCPQLSEGLAAGASCTFAVNFIPTTTGTLSGALVLTDNHLNAAAPSYAKQSIGLTGTGVQATVTASVTAASKLYDGTTVATISCVLSGVLPADAGNVTCSAASAAFATAGIGNGITVTATGIALGGSAAYKYVLSSTTATTTANIVGALTIAAGVTATDKSYDGTTAATITCVLSGLLPVDMGNVTCSASSASFATAGVGNGITVTATGLTLSGSAASRYVLQSATATTAASILQIPLMVIAKSQTILLGDPVPPLRFTYFGFVNGEDASLVTTAPTCTTTATSTSPLGTYPITCSGGTVAPQYALNFVNGTLTVTTMAAHFDWAELTVSTGFNQLRGVAVDGSGNIYVAETGKNAVEEILAASGYAAVNTLGSGFNRPYGVAVDGNGNVYVADMGNNAVKEIVAAGGYSTVNTLGSGFNRPYGVAVDGKGNVYVADSGNNAVKEILAAGSYSTVQTLGNGFSSPQGVAVDTNGNVYVGDTGNGAVKEILAPGSYTTVNTLGAGFKQPYGVAVDGSGDVYFADSGDSLLFLITPGTGLSQLGTGFSQPSSVAVDRSGSVYVADTGNTAVKEVSFAPRLPAVVGATSSTVSFNFIFDTRGAIGAPAVLTQGAAGFDFADAKTGSCTSSGPSHTYAPLDSCTVDVSFTPQHPSARLGAVQLTTPAGVLVATATVSGAGVGPQVVFSSNNIPSKLGSGFNQPGGAAIDVSGNVFVADTANNAVKMVLAAGGYTTVNALGSGFSQPSGVTVDGSGNVFVADTGNNAVKEILAAGGYTTVNTLGSGFNQPSSVVVDGSGNVFVADTGNNAVKEIVAGSYVITLGSGFLQPYGVAVDTNGNVYVADTGNNAVKEILTAGGYTAVNALGSGFNEPDGIAVDGSGNVFVAETGNSVVKEILAAGGYTTVNTLGSGFNQPSSVVVDGSGNVFVADTGNNAVKKLDFSDAPSLSFASTTVGSSSSDSPQTVTIANDGNAILTFPVSPSLPAGFTLANSSTCLQLGGGGLAAGASCTYAVNFIPTTAGGISGSLVLTDNHLNAAEPGYATQSIGLNGTGSAKMLTVSLIAASKIYDGTTAAAITCVLSGVLPADVGRVTCSAASASFASAGIGNGIAVTANGITLSGSAAGKYVLSSSTANTAADITSASLTVTANNASKTYGAANPALIYSVTGYVNGDTAAVLSGSPSLTTAATAGSGVGSYPITPSAGSLAAANYRFTFVNGTLAINPAVMTVTASSPSVTYGAPVPAITASYSGFQGSESSSVLTTQPTCSTAYTATSAAGSSPSTSCSGATAANYTFIYTPGSVTIGKATVTVTASSLSVSYGAAVPAITAGYNGFANGDTVATTVIAAPLCSTTYTPTTMANTTTTASCAGGIISPNYVFSYLNGTVTIQQAPSTLTMSPSSATIEPNQAVTLTAQVLSTTTGTPTGTVNFYDGTTLLNSASLNGGVASYSTSSLASGAVHALTAVYGGDNNFLGSNSATSVTVGPLDFTVTVTGQSTLSVVPGSAGVFTVQITPMYGCIGSPLTLFAAGLPSRASITFNPATISAGCQPQTITATIQTASATARTRPQSTPARRTVPLALALLLLPLLGAKRMRRAGKRVGGMFSLLLLLCGMAAGAAITGCGSANGFFAQPPHSYTVTFTAAGGGLTHSVDVTIQLQ